MELELPPELVVHVFAQAPILALPRLALVCRAWAAASRSDDVWHAVIARRWSFSRHSFGARFPCWRDVFLTLLAIDPREQMHSSSNGMIIELNVLSCSARSFILGIARDGWFPTADGIFTYHEEGATPVHYRHFLQSDPLHPFASDELRLGGEWRWSCDRIEWFATLTLPQASTHISSGVFASSDFNLVETNLELVQFLERWPVVPLIREEVITNTQDGVTFDGDGRLEMQPDVDPTSDEAFWRASHSHLISTNKQQLDGLMDAIYSAEPTTSCLALRALTCHLHLMPVWLIQPTRQGWQPLCQSAAQRNLAAVLSDFCVSNAMSRAVVIPVPGPHGSVNIAVRLWEHVYEFDVMRRQFLADDLSYTEDMDVTFSFGHDLLYEL